jgi:hypothetical protein
LLNLIFNSDPEDDVQNIVHFLKALYKELYFGEIQIDEGKIRQVVYAINLPTSYSNGAIPASIFRKISSLVCNFVEISPISNSPVLNNYWGNFAKIPNFVNAHAAFKLAEFSLGKATIARADGTFVSIDENLDYSSHSYVDIVEALSTVKAAEHFKLMTVFLEQLVYKTNKLAYPMPLKYIPEGP